MLICILIFTWFSRHNSRTQYNSFTKITKFKIKPVYNTVLNLLVSLFCCLVAPSGRTDRQTYILTNQVCNPRCACASRVNKKDCPHLYKNSYSQVFYHNIHRYSNIRTTPYIVHEASCPSPSFIADNSQELGSSHSQSPDEVLWNPNQSKTCVQTDTRHKGAIISESLRNRICLMVLTAMNFRSRVTDLQSMHSKEFRNAGCTHDPKLAIPSSSLVV